MDALPETMNGYSCRWRFCSSTFPTKDAVSAGEQSLRMLIKSVTSTRDVRTDESLRPL